LGEKGKKKRGGIARGATPAEVGEEEKGGIETVGGLPGFEWGKKGGGGKKKRGGFFVFPGLGRTGKKGWKA